MTSYYWLCTARDNTSVIYSLTHRAIICNVMYRDHTCKKSLKIPKGGNQNLKNRRTDKTMVKRKRTNNDLQNTTQKTKD